MFAPGMKSGPVAHDDRTASANSQRPSKPTDESAHPIIPLQADERTALAGAYELLGRIVGRAQANGGEEAGTAG
jgi:hypothetical protein